MKFTQHKSFLSRFFPEFNQRFLIVGIASLFILIISAILPFTLLFFILLVLADLLPHFLRSIHFLSLIQIRDGQLHYQHMKWNRILPLHSVRLCEVNLERKAMAIRHGTCRLICRDKSTGKILFNQVSTGGWTREIFGKVEENYQAEAERE